MSGQETLDADVLVVGGGMGGMSAAASLAQDGAEVIVVEIASDIGGSAAMSEGWVWTQQDTATFLATDPLGDVAQFEALLAGLPEAYEWVRHLGAAVGPDTPIVNGRGRQVDVGAFFKRTRAVVEANAGWIFCNAEVTGWENGGDRRAALVRRTDTDETVVIRARAVVLATGGFHADEGMRRRYGIPNAEHLVVRGNRWNRGGGLALGLAAGGSTTPHMQGFYGHPFPYPLEEWPPEHLTALAMYVVARGIVVGLDGARFCEEPRGYSHVAQALAPRGRGLLVIDEDTRRDVLMAAYAPGMDSSVDKLALAKGLGAHVATVHDVDELAGIAASWGYPADEVVRTVRSSWRGAPAGSSADEATGHAPALSSWPCHLVEVQPSITFTHGGLRTDVGGRVLDTGGHPVPRLYASGVDAGGLNRKGYSGGLVRGLVMGRTLRQTMRRDAIEFVSQED